MRTFSRFILLGAIMPAAASAQTAPSDSAAMALARVRQTAIVRLAVEGDRISGTFDRMAGGTILRDERTDRFIPIAAIDTIWRRDSDAAAYARKGRNWGAVAGGGMLALVTRGLRGEPDAVVAAIPVGAIGGGLIGMAIGAVAGSANARWTVIFQR